MTDWISTTLGAMLIVAALWIGALGIFHVLRKLRRMPRGEELRISRSLQVGFGGLFVLATILPFLTMNYPVAAILLLVGAVGAGVVFGRRQPVPEVERGGQNDIIAPN